VIETFERAFQREASEERGVRVSIATMSRAIRNKELGWTYKKRRWVPPSETNGHEILGESV
jgi:transposase